MELKKLFSLAAMAVLLSAATAAATEWTWTEILSDDFSTDPSANWSFSGKQNGSAQDLIRWNAAGRLDAEWDQSNNIVASGDPYIIEPSRYSQPLGQTFTDDQTFKVGVTLRINSVASTTEMYEVANFGLYGLAHMGPDRTMADNWSGNTTLIKDGSDFVEWNYFIMNESFGCNPCTVATIGAHITGTDGDYTTGTSGDPSYFHDTDMGAGNYLPTATNLYVELTYYGAAADGDRRRAHAAVYTDEARTTILAVAGVEQYYWTEPLADAKSFSLTDVAFFNYVATNWGGANGTGSGTFDDVYVAAGAVTIPGDANKDGIVDGQDFTILKANYGQAGGWGEGNFNGDATVDGQDFTIMKAHYGEGGSQPVPGPATIVLLGAAGPVLLRRAKRRGKLL